MLSISSDVFDSICAQALAEYPLEMCGLIAGQLPTPGSRAADPAHADSVKADTYFRCTNVAASAKVYTVDPGEHLKAELAAERDDREIIGVVHSHTHTEPFPSPTDIAQAPDPDWHYLIVSLKRSAPELRSYRIVDGTVTEEPVAIVGASPSI